MEPDLNCIPQAEVLARLNVAPETLSILVDDYHVLAFQLSYGEVVYPDFQFGTTFLLPQASLLFQHFKKAQVSGQLIVEWLWSYNDLLEASPLKILLQEGYSDRLAFVASVTSDVLAQK